MKKYTDKLPLIVSLLIIITVIAVDFNHKNWNREGRVIFWDIINYYEYLPSAFIYNDITLKFAELDHEKFHDKVWAEKMPNGNYVNKMSMGMSVMYSPFFLAAHWLAGPLRYEKDGYSLPYRFALVMSSAIWLLIGLLFLSSVLQRFFSPLVTAVTLLSLVIGTNLLFYATIEAPMSHTYSFALFSMFLYTVIKFYEYPSLLNAFLTGLLAGLISLVRPSNIVVVLVFVFWGINSVKSIQTRWALFLKRPGILLLVIFSCIIVWIPQVLYWKYITGSYFYYSYGGERFFFDSPQIINGLFSYRKGWLLYTPMMALALAGIYFLYKRNKGVFWPVLIFTVVNTWVVLSWWSWWYGGSFGLRAFIESYAILSLPLACLIESLITKGRALRYGLFLVIILLNLHSIFQTMQYYYGSIHWVGMTKEAYWDSFGKLHPSERFQQLLQPEPTLDEIKAARNTE